MNTSERVYSESTGYAPVAGAGIPGLPGLLIKLISRQICQQCPGRGMHLLSSSELILSVIPLAYPVLTGEPPYTRFSKSLSPHTIHNSEGRPDNNIPNDCLDHY